MKRLLAPEDLRRTIDAPTDQAVVIDTETTGLIPGKDEILSLAIVDLEGNALFHSLIRPLERRRWPNAAEIHGITWKDVKGKPTILDVGNEVSDLLNNASLIIGYNTNFDLEMLHENGLPAITAPSYDLMEEYANGYGNWSDRKGAYLYCRLSQCAKRYGYNFSSHDALEDARATAYCFHKFREECDHDLPASLERQEEQRKLKEAAQEEQRRIEEEEANRKAQQAKKDRVLRWGGASLCIASLCVPFTSCAMTGGDLLASFGLDILAFLVFIAGATLLLVGSSR